MRLFWAFVLAATAFAANADEAAVRNMMEGKLRGGSSIASIVKAPWGDFYEVAMHGPDGLRIFYVDSAATVIIAGQAIDAKSGRNFTEERQRKLTMVQWDSLPFDSAIVTKKGDGRRKIAVFSDPNCPYCKVLEQHLAEIENLTVYIFPYAVISPKSVQQAKTVWCSPDRAKAWNDLMFRRVESQAAPDCDTPIEELIQLGRRLGATSTPTWFLENGERYSGALPLQDIRQLLDRAASAKR
jgi:thiol:disulfide interchange protein DsbC